MSRGIPSARRAYLALQIMLCLSLRRSDVVEVGPRHVRKTAEHPDGVLDDYQPVKARRTGGRHVTVPLHPDLVAAIAAMPVIGTDTSSAHRARQGVHGERFRRPDARLVRRGESAADDRRDRQEQKHRLAWLAQNCAWCGSPKPGAM